MVEVPTERRKHRKKQPSVERSVIKLLPNADENGKRQKDKKETHFANIAQAISRQNASYIITDKRGATPQFCGTEMEKDTFDLFFTPDMIENIVLYTNKRIENIMAQLPKTFLIFKYIHI